MPKTVIPREEISDFELVPVGNIPSARMNEETGLVDELQKYYVLQPLNEAGEEEGRGVKIAWFEDSKRAVIIHGKDVQWTYAEDPDDAAERWLAGEVDEDADPRPKVMSSDA
jgi:hypothetical protein